MTNPASNWCHPTNDLKMMQDSANDLTIGSAVERTSGTLYTEFDDLRTNAYSGFIDGTYGTRGGTPTESEHFRGYPLVHVSAAFSEYAGQSDTPNSLRVECRIVNKVGFDVITVFQNLDVDSTAYECTIAAGNLTSGLSPLFTTGGADIIYTITWYTTGTTLQLTPATLTGDTTGTLVYTAPAETILNDFGVSAVFYDSDSCAAGTTATGYYLESIWAASAITIGVTGITLYQGDRASNGGTTTAASKVFRRANLSLGYDKIVTNASGVITSNTQCSP